MQLFLITFIILFSTLSYSKDMPEIKLKYLALGDSYTIGESVSESERFPILLTEGLRERGYEIDGPLIIAKTGWTTGELSSALDEKEPIGEYDLVTLLIGVNNQYRGRDAEEYRVEFARLLKRTAGYTNSFENVIVISIPDWGVTPFTIDKGRDPQKVGKEIDLYNSIKKEETENVGAHYVYITDISKEAKNDETLLAEDKLHPSGKMYSIWVERIIPVAKQILDKK